MELKNAKVLITGGTTGIGYATAKLLKDNGAQVVICGRNKEHLDKAIKETGVSGMTADVSREEDISRLFEYAIDTMGDLNVLVNNAGFGYYSPLTETSAEDLRQMWETNVLGAFLAGKYAARHFIMKDTGNIINISSSAGKRGFANGSAYVASKFALSGLTECWRAELRKHNVRVMQINPSEVITEFYGKAGQKHTNVDHKLKAGEIAHVVLSMLSMNDVGFITEASVWATNPDGTGNK